MKKSIITLFAILITIIFSSCYTPSPLYGSWNDNVGNKITFMADGTFVSKIYNSNNQPISYEGDYSVIDNVLVFATKDGYVINTEWDIRGAMLYLTWTIDPTQQRSLTLYHTSK